MGTATKQWRRLTRGDLTGFDEFAKQIVLCACESGGVGRFSSNHHIILRAPDGGTMAVSSDTETGNRARQNLAAQFKRLFPEAAERLIGNGVRREIKAMQEQQQVSLDKAVAKGPLGTAAEPTLQCRAKGCDKEFVTEGARYSHEHKEHYPCKEPGCTWVGAVPQARVMHGVREHSEPYQHVCVQCGKSYKSTAPNSATCSKECRNKQDRLKRRQRYAEAQDEQRRAAARERKSQQQRERRARQRAEEAQQAAVADQVVKADMEGTPVAPRPVAPRSQQVANALAGSTETPREYVPFDPTVDPAKVLASIRGLLGQDPRVAQLQAELDLAKKHIAELEARLALMREALNA